MAKPMKSPKPVANSSKAALDADMQNDASRPVTRKQVDPGQKPDKSLKQPKSKKVMY